MSAQVATTEWIEWGILVLFAGMWGLVSYIFAHASGWQRLATRFRATRRAPSPLKRFVSGRLECINYNSCLTVGADAHGLYLVPLLPFRAFHPPLHIPWSGVRARTQERFLFLTFDLFDLGPDLPRIQVQRRATRAVDAYLPYSG